MGYYSCTGRSGTTTLQNSSTTTTLIPISTYIRSAGFSGLTMSSDGGVTLSKGDYLISASIWMQSESIANGRIGRAIFIKDSPNHSGNEIASHIEHQYDSGKGVAGSIGIPAKILSLSSSKTLYLHARCVGSTATVYNDNTMTYITILKLS